MLHTSEILSELSDIELTAMAELAKIDIDPELRNSFDPMAIQTQIFHLGYEFGRSNLNRTTSIDDCLTSISSLGLDGHNLFYDGAFDAKLASLADWLHIPGNL